MSKIRRNPKPMSLEALVSEIISLEEDGIISFEDLVKIPFYKIQGDYFPMAHTTLINKALIKVSDIKAGNKTLSTYTTETISHKENKVTVKRKTDYF